MESYGKLRFPSEDSGGIRYSENTMCIRVNEVTMQKVSQLKRSLNARFFRICSEYFPVHLFQTQI